MRIKERLNRIAFSLTGRLLPPYYRCKWANRLRNTFAKNIFTYVGEGVNWGRNLSIESDFQIGNYSGVGNMASIPKGVTIGDNVMIGKNLEIITVNHRIDRVDIPMRGQGFLEISPLVVEDDVWICNNVLITPGCCRVGKGSVLAAGAVITKDVEPYSIVGGNPAKIIRYRK